MTYLSADPLPALTALLGSLRGRAKDWEEAERAAPSSVWPGLPRHTLFFESGRVALWGALRALRLDRGDRLVAPAYVCDSILPALNALGVEVRYVPTDSHLELDLEVLERELAGGARAVLIVHYFGFPAAGLGGVAALCQRYGAALIEDCAHALFSQAQGQPLGGRGAAAIFSPWKSLPLPEGGALVLNGPLAPDDLARLARPRRLQSAVRLAYRSIGVVETALGRSPRLWLLQSRSLRSRMQARAAEAPFAARRSSRLAEALILGADWKQIVARRREHYGRLAAALSGARWAELLHDQLPPGVCPLGLPLLVERREWARRRLLAAGVNVRAYWERLPTGVTRQAFPTAHSVADRILVLPVHQSLTTPQLEALIAVLTRMDAV